jgi:hypothetical protein
MEGGWDRQCDRARILREYDGNDKPLAEGKNNNHKYKEDSNIPNNHNKCALGLKGVNEPFDEGNNEYDTLNAAPMQACPESQRLSVPSC